ncbi:MAG: TetR family transcriptional regulator, partial [Mesorhizobium sp.]|uniref:TetR family transcriptional regulator C-terminal domain-containing protein n=1 Tax=Mesorhizobium sp. TaxID=1871066 RepID=UPI00121887C8
FSLWATFIGRAGADPTLARAHREGYLGFRNEVEGVVAEVLAAERRKPDASELRHHAIAINAIIDGLWIEGCLAGEMFSPGELAAIGIKAIEAELGLAPEKQFQEK